MKKIKLDIQDLLVVLESMIDGGTTEIVFFEHNSFPAIADAENPDNIIAFAPVEDEEEEKDEDDQIH